MIPEIGHFALALAVALAFAQGVIGIFAPGLRDPRAMRAAPALAISQLLAIGASFLCLIYAGVVSDFTVENVADFSSSAVPLLYRITGTWGNHDGSMLLWCCMLSACGAVVAAFGHNLPSSLRARVLGVLGLVSGGFHLFALTVSDPLARLWPPPLQGAGINPILQDPGLAFHPPMLYAGYVGFSVAFAFAVAALIEGRIDAAWGRWVRPWALLSGFFSPPASRSAAGGPITRWAGAGSGSGPGGKRRFAALAHRHGAAALRDRGGEAGSAESLVGTARHRHLLAQPVRHLPGPLRRPQLRALLRRGPGSRPVPPGAARPHHRRLAAAVRGARPGAGGHGMFSPLSRESALVLNNIFLCAIATVVFVGTLYPPFVNLLFGIQLSVGAPFFNQTVLPLTAPLIIAMAIGPMLPWKRADLAPALARLWLAAGVALVVFLVTTAERHVVTALGLAGGIWVVLSALIDLAERLRLFRVPLGTSFTRLVTLPRAAIGATLGHLGFGVTVLGIAGMTLATQKVIVMQPGQTTELGGYGWTLDDIHDAPGGGDYTLRVADITLSAHGHALLTLHPSRRDFSAQDTTTDDAAINTNGFQDIYAVFSDEPAGGGAELRLNRHPLAPEIWFGGLIMALGGVVSLSDRRLRVGAPARAKRREKPAEVVA